MLIPFNSRMHASMHCRPMRSPCLAKSRPCAGGTLGTRAPIAAIAALEYRLGPRGMFMIKRRKRENEDRGAQRQKSGASLSIGASVAHGPSFIFLVHMDKSFRATHTAAFWCPLYCRIVSPDANSHNLAT